MDFHRLQGRLDAAVDSALNDRRIVGGVVQVARAGDLVVNRVAGMADREAGVPVAEDTIFRFASFTKPVVAATALSMVERGLIAVHDPVTRYLPWFTPALTDGTRPVITIHHVLTHTAGLARNVAVQPDEMDDPALKAVGMEVTRLSLEVNMKRLAQRELLYAPGTDWAYSAATDLLGLIVANIHGGTLGDALAAYVFVPLGMPDTQFGVAAPARLAQAYANGTPEPHVMANPETLTDPKGVEATLYPGRILHPQTHHSGGSGLAGTTPDFMKFLVMLQRGGRPILSRESVELGTRNQVGDAGLGKPNPGERFGCIGAVVVDPVANNSPAPQGTYRWGGVFGGSWFIDPVNELCVVALTNTAREGDNGRFVRDIRDAVYA